MKEFFLNNVYWIGLAATIFIGSNVLTGVSVNSMSKKDKRELQKQLDSIERIFLSEQASHIVEAKMREQEDKKIAEDYNNMLFRARRAEIEVIKKEQEIAKIRILSSTELAKYADSLYNAYH